MPPACCWLAPVGVLLPAKRPLAWPRWLQPRGNGWLTRLVDMLGWLNWLARRGALTDCRPACQAPAGLAKQDSRLLAWPSRLQPRGNDWLTRLVGLTGWLNWLARWDASTDCRPACQAPAGLAQQASTKGQWDDWLTRLDGSTGSLDWLAQPGGSTGFRFAPVCWLLLACCWSATVGLA